MRASCIALPGTWTRARVGAALAGAALVGFALAGSATVAPAVAQSGVASPARSTVTIATATPGGNYFLTGNAICRALQRQGHYLPSGDVTRMTCQALSTSGSIQNVDLMRNGVVDVALLQSDWHYHGFSGTDRFEGRAVPQLRSLVSFNQEAFQLLAGRGLEVAAWPDVKGKKVNVGPNGSTAGTMFNELFKVHGVDETWLSQALRLPPTQHIQEMCEGNIEVLGQTSGVPNAGIADAHRRCGASLVSLDTPEIRKMVDDLIYYIPVTIPKGTYAGQATDVQTFGVVATLVANADLPDSIAYSIVRAVFEGLADMQAAVPVLRGIKLDAMISDGLTAPLHPGAARYFRERGFIRTGRPTASLAPAGPAATQLAAAGAPADSEPAVAPAADRVGSIGPATLAKLTPAKQTRKAAKASKIVTAKFVTAKFVTGRR